MTTLKKIVNNCVERERKSSKCLVLKVSDPIGYIPYVYSVLKDVLNEHDYELKLLMKNKETAEAFKKYFAVKYMNNHLTGYDLSFSTDFFRARVNYDGYLVKFWLKNRKPGVNLREFILEKYAWVECKNGIKGFFESTYDGWVLYIVGMDSIDVVRAADFVARILWEIYQTSE